MKRLISLWKFVLVLSLFVTVVTLPMPATAQLNEPFDELVFMSNAAVGWDIYKWKGGATTQLTFDPMIDWTPRAAPGGGRIAFVSTRDGDAEIYVVDFDGTNERRLTRNESADWYPSWSPSGKRLVYSSDRDGDHEIRIMDVDGSYDIQLTYNNVWDSHPAYSPDGKRIAFTSNLNRNNDIWIMNADGTNLWQLTVNPANDQYPAWSPDGKKIAFTSARGANTDIWIINVDPNPARRLPLRLTVNPARDWAPVWSPDGKWIAFSTNRDVDEEVYGIPMVGGVAAGLAFPISNNPLADDRYPDFFWPRMPAAGKIVWERTDDWRPRGVPGKRDRVLIPAGTVNITSGNTKVVSSLTVNGVLRTDWVHLWGPFGNDLGILPSSCSIYVRAPKGIKVGNGGTIEAGKDTSSRKGGKVDLNARPDGTITIDGAVRGGEGASVRPHYSEDGGSVYLHAKKVVISATGKVEGGDGGEIKRHWREAAGKGGDVTVTGEYITIERNLLNSGLIKGGDGGNTDTSFKDPTPGCPPENCRYPQYGGDGGSVFLGSGFLPGTRYLEVNGNVYGGNGGDIAGSHEGRCGNGGDVKLNVQWGVWGVLKIGMGAKLKGGDGGSAIPKTHAVWGSNGGDVFTLVSFSTTVAGKLEGGKRGLGNRVNERGGDGFKGSVTCHPPSITFTDTAQVNGRNVWIYGGEGWGINLSQVEPGAISADESITVAVDSGGWIDLSGHGQGESVLTAGEGIYLYADSDQIQMDSGVSVADLTSSPVAQVEPARTIYRGFLHAEGNTTSLPDDTAEITLTLTNAGSGPDTFQFAATDTSGWSWQLSPTSLSLEPMEEGVVVATAAVPEDAAGLLNEVTFSARSTADPSQTAVVNLYLHVVESPPIPSCQAWNRTFGGSKDDRGYSVQQTADGGYIILGDTSSYGAGGDDFWLIKTDVQGNKQWDRTFGGSSGDYSRSVQQTRDGGYILLGSTYSFGAGRSDAWLIKTDADGNKQWDRTFGGSDYDFGRSVQQAQDGGYIILGSTDSYGAGSRDFWLIKTDADGNIDWKKTFGGIYSDYPKSVQQTLDGGYILLGGTLSYGAGSVDAWLIKTDAQGNKQWERTFGSSENDWGESVQQTSDGGFVLIGHTDSYTGGEVFDLWLIKTDTRGNKQWDKTFGGSYLEYGKSVQQTSDGGFILLGYTESYGAGDYDFWLIKTDAQGNRQWDKTFGGSKEDKSSSVQQTSDGGYILLGYTESYGAGDADLWLIKYCPEVLSCQAWNRTFGGSKDDRGYSVQHTMDGGYVLLGYTKSYGAGGEDIWLIKTDVQGDKQWDRTFGGSSEDSGGSVQQAQDGGYIILGSTYSYGAGRSDAWLIKTDADGNKQWDMTFGGSSRDYGDSVQQAQDGGYILLGTTESYGAGGEDIWLIKTDAQGNKEWDKTFNMRHLDYGESVQQTEDGGYILLGRTANYNGEEGWDFWLIKTDAQGNKEWDKIFGGSEDDVGTSVQQTEDGDYILLGYTESYGAGNNDFWLIKIDAQGNKEWDRTFGMSEWDYGISVQQTEDGGYVLFGSTSSHGAGKGDFWLIKTDAHGNKEWDKTFGGSEGDWGRSVQQTSDGGYILLGNTKSYGAGNDDFWLIKYCP